MTRKEWLEMWDEIKRIEKLEIELYVGSMEMTLE